MARVMNCSSLIGVIFLLVSAKVSAAEVGLLLGEPDGSLPFVQSILVLQENYQTETQTQFDQDYTNQAFYLADELGVISVNNMSVLANGMTDGLSLRLALESAAKQSTVVVTTLGGDDEFLCELMARHPQTAFVVAAGNHGRDLTFPHDSTCLARNILRVTQLNLDKSDLEINSNRGQGVRIAVSGHGKMYPVALSQVTPISPGLVGVMRMAGMLAKLSRCNCGRAGDQLIELMLQDNAVVLPTLVGKVEGALALLRDLY